MSNENPLVVKVSTIYLSAATFAATHMLLLMFDHYMLNDTLEGWFDLSTTYGGVPYAVMFFAAICHMLSERRIGGRGWSL